MSDAPNLPVRALREAAQRAVDASSLRAVAEAVGISHTGLRKILEGAEPHAGTLRKLAEWYVRGAASAHDLDSDTAAAAMALLVGSVPPGQQAQLRRALVADLRDAHVHGGVEPPAWLMDH